MAGFLQENGGMTKADRQWARSALTGETWKGVWWASLGTDPKEWREMRTMLVWSFYVWTDLPPELNDWGRAGLDTGSILVESVRHWMRGVNGADSKSV